MSLRKLRQQADKARSSTSTAALRMPPALRYQDGNMVAKETGEIYCTRAEWDRIPSEAFPLPVMSIRSTDPDADSLEVITMAGDNWLSVEEFRTCYCGGPCA